MRSVNRPHFLALVLTSFVLLSSTGFAKIDRELRGNTLDELAPLSSSLQFAITFNPPGPLAVTSGVLINEVYGGGGNTGAPFNQDFIELFNNGATAVNISGFTLQYGSATGAFGTVATIPVSTSLAAGAFYTISIGPTGANGSALPGVDLVAGGSGMSLSAGKVRLLDASAVIIDLVGYGPTADTFETAPTAAPGNPTSVQRIPNGVDTDNNSADFKVLSPTPDATNVPEPSTWVMIGIGVVLLGGVQRFRRKSG